MAAYLARRLLQALLVMLVMSLAVFAGVYAIGNPVAILIPPDASQADAARLAADLGLDRPLWVQYGHFLAQAASGNLGTSFFTQTSVMTEVGRYLPNTLELIGFAILVAFVIGAFFAGIAGGLYGHFKMTITPTGFDFTKSIEIVVMVILGGMGRHVGVVAPLAGEARHLGPDDDARFGGTVAQVGEEGLVARQPRDRRVDFVERPRVTRLRVRRHRRGSEADEEMFHGQARQWGMLRCRGSEVNEDRRPL